MNCQHISRIVDTGRFGALTASERRDCEEHAHSCRHCAPLWTAHACIGGTVVPAMPPELSVRCLTLAAANSQSASRHASRRVKLVVGGVVALAAAAAMLAVDFFDNPAPRDQPVAVIPPMPELPAEALPAVEAPASTPVAAVSPATVEAKDPFYGLPLIPAPIRADAERKFQIDLVKRKAQELYPEITSGPEIDGTFVVSLNLRADGTVLGKSLAIANSTEELNAEMHKMKPLNGSQTFIGLRKGAQQDGKALRGHLTVAFSVVSSSFDVSRANARVEQIVRAERGHLMLPTAKGGMNTLTVLFSDDGAIQRENVEFISSQGGQSQAKKPAGVEARAQEMARKLGVGVERIGVMGSTWIDNAAADSADRKYLLIDYAWPRRAGEEASRILQDENIFSERGIDLAAALIVIERMMPEVFLQPDRPASGPSTNAPTIVFTAEGRVIGTGRMNLQSSELPAQQVQRLVPGVRISTAESVTVRNAGGRSASVQFLWEATPAQMEAQDIAERARRSE